MLYVGDSLPPSRSGNLWTRKPCNGMEVDIVQGLTDMVQHQQAQSSQDFLSNARVHEMSQWISHDEDENRLSREK